MSTIETMNNERERARQIIEFTNTHLFLTGKAGTGKTTFLRQLKEDAPKRMIVLAPTGIAAINAGGSTIHSFFQLPFAPFIPDERYQKMDFKLRKQKIKLIRSLDLIVIDEISMVRADLLDQMDAVLRQYRNHYEPFGGVQLLMIGDLQQLAPVAKNEEWNLLSKYYDSPYFFSSHALKQTEYVTIELQKVYRQSDPTFLHLLNCIRSNNADAKVLSQLNQRYIPNFAPHKEDRYIRLVTHNWQAQQINEGELSKIKEKTYTYKADIEGTFPEYSYPTEGILSLKAGAQVMFVKNDLEKRYYNGTLGEIIDINEKVITVRTADSGFEINLEKEEWLNTRYALNEETQKIEEKVEGSFHQFPVKLAWAITIHKSQGLTFEHAIIDAHSAFAHGQTYVALSRCKTLEGLVLSSPIPASAIIQDQAVCEFNRNVEQQQPTEKSILQLRHQHCLNLIGKLFDFSAVRHSLFATIRLIEEHFYQLYPETLKKYQEFFTTLNNNVLTVAEKFRLQYQRLISEGDEEGISEELQTRIQKGANYFHGQLSPLWEMVRNTILPSDNKEINKRATNTLEDFNQAISQKCMLLNYVGTSGFHIAEYQKNRALVLAGEVIKPNGGIDETSTPHKEESSKSKKQEKLVVPAEIRHPDLYRTLVGWRKEKAQAEKVPPYMVIQNKAILGISNLLPTDLRTLGMIPYFGVKGLEKYGEDILEIIHIYTKQNHLKQEQLSLFTDKSKEKDEKKEKTSKEPSFSNTLRLFLENKSIEQIAQERSLSPATVSGHLVQCVEKGLLPLEKLVTAGKIAYIRHYLEQLPNLSSIKISEIKEALGEKFEYHEIRAVMTTLKKA